jgi:tetratricopeptide (TPR) repeat protein
MSCMPGFVLYYKMKIGMVRLIFFFLFSGCLFGNGNAQITKQQALSLQQTKIEHLFDSLSVQGINMEESLVYKFHFYDNSQSKLGRLAVMMDTVRFHHTIQKKYSKLYVLELSQIAIHNPKSLFETDREMRKWASRRNIDAYEFHEVSRPDTHKELVSKEDFTFWISQLEDDELFESGMKLHEYALYDKAQETFITCLTKEIKADTAYYMLGRIQLDQDKFRKGIEYLKLAIKVNPRYVEAVKVLGEVFLDNYYYEEAIVYLAIANQLDPADDETLYNLALVRFQLHQYNQSFDNCREILKRNKRHAGAKYLLTMFRSEYVRTQRKLFPAR